ncbi:unnamed protein product, partial [Mesorhabditis spiculigera]
MGINECSIEPSTIGTSWNSVRWNKPATTGYRSHSARVRDSFESRPSLSSTTPSYSSRASSTPKYGSSSAVRMAHDLVSLGPSVPQRASRFDSSAQEKYREEARELLEKYTNRTPAATTPASTTSLKSGYYSRHFEPRKLTETSPRLPSVSSYVSPSPRASASYRPSITPSRCSVEPPSSRYSAERSLGPSSINYPSSTYSTSKERPWRTRLAESARLRATVGDEASASYSASRASRRGSLSQASGDEGLSRELRDLRSSVATVRPTGRIKTDDHVEKIFSEPPYRTSSRQSSVESSVGSRFSRYSTPTSTRTGALFSSASTPYRSTIDTSRSKTSSQMSRSFSPIRSSLDPMDSLLTTRQYATRSLSPSSREALRRVSSTEKATISMAPTTSPIQEGNERDERTRKRSSSKARAARRASRQREADKTSESEGERGTDRSISRQRRRSKKKGREESLPARPPPHDGTAETEMVALSPTVVASPPGPSGPPALRQGVSVVEPGRVRLVLRHGVISRLLGAGERTTPIYETDSDNNSDSDGDAPWTAPAPVVRFFGPKSGDPAVNRARYQTHHPNATYKLSCEVVEGQRYPKPLSTHHADTVEPQRYPNTSATHHPNDTYKLRPTQRYQKPLSKHQAEVVEPHRYPKPFCTHHADPVEPQRYPSTLATHHPNDTYKLQKTAASTSESTSKKYPEKTTTTTAAPKKPWRQGTLISRIKSTLEFRASGRNLQLEEHKEEPTVLNLPTQPEKPIEKEKKPSKISSFFNRMLRKTPRGAKEEKPQPPVHCNADDRVKHGFALQKPTVVAELDSKLQTKRVESTTATSAPRQALQKPVVEPKSGSPKTLVKVEKRENGRFTVPELKRVTSPILPHYGWNLENKKEEKNEAQNRPLGVVRPFSRTGNPADRNLAIGPMPAGTPENRVETVGPSARRLSRGRTNILDDLGGRSHHVEPAEQPLDIGRLNSLKTPLGKPTPPHQAVDAPTLQAEKSVSPNSSNLTPKGGAAQLIQGATPHVDSNSSNLTRKNGTAQPHGQSAAQAHQIDKPFNPNKPNMTAKIAQPNPEVAKPRPPTEAEQLERLHRLEEELRAQRERLELLAAKPLLPENPPAIVTERKVLVKYSDSLHRVRKNPPCPPPKPIPEQPTPWIVRPAPLDISQYVQERVEGAEKIEKMEKGRKMVKYPRDLLNPVVSGEKEKNKEKPMPLWRLQNIRRFGETKSLPAEKSGKASYGEPAFHTPPPEPIITVAPPTPTTPKKMSLDVEDKEKKLLKNIRAEKLASPTCIPWDSSFELEEAYSDASVIDDESQYSAVTHFVPKKIKRPPVPGVWVKDGVELISKNKSFRREDQAHTTVSVWEGKRRERAALSKNFEAPDKKKVVVTEKKRMVLRKKKLSTIDPKDVERARKEREISPEGKAKKEPVTTTVTATLQHKHFQKATVVRKLPYTERQSISHARPFKARRKAVPLALAAVDREFKRKPAELRVQKTMMSYGLVLGSSYVIIRFLKHIPQSA